MSIKFQFIILKIKKKESQIFFAFSCTFSGTKHKNTNIKFDFRLTKKKKKIDIHNQSIYQHKHPFLMPHHNIHNPLNPLLIPITISITNETTKTIANRPHFLNHQTNPSLLILNPHVSLVYQIEERQKKLRIWKSDYRFSN